MSQPVPILTPGDQVVIYDGVCKLCNAWVRFLLSHRLPPFVRFAPVQSREGRVLLEHIGMSADSIHTIVLFNGQQYWIRSEAIFRIMRFLPWPWRLLALLRFLPLAVTDSLYNSVARNRYRIFGRYDTLRSLESDHPDRFLNQ
ncbi:thiol-disulfide oxidoreductase DCC family protein [Pantoea sp. ME81]|uniref:thiol-disulfide oxidoreductase DCC family protein n=1 Tax=unclassified Pantoea TaxID=2630326 RepID=UPI0015F7033A|nr:DCC1-like thiol-disulfide oxidoreductase family protein [Pantoea sp. ME81]